MLHQMVISTHDEKSVSLEPIAINADDKHTNKSRNNNGDIVDNKSKLVSVD